MAQAELELPDPLEMANESAASLPVENADDLMAQLAGQEIDRMLAETDGGDPVMPTPRSKLAPREAPVSIEHTTRQITPEPEPFHAPAEEPVEHLVDEHKVDHAEPPLIETTRTEQEHHDAEPAVSAPTPAKQSAADELASEDLNAVLATATAERAALKESVTPASPLGPLAAAVEGDLSKQSPKIELAGDPWWHLLLRPLEWINSPLDAWPDAVRDAIGKVAVITLLNSVAVIAYVLVFRRHHH